MRRRLVGAGVRAAGVGAMFALPAACGPVAAPPPALPPPAPVQAAQASASSVAPGPAGWPDALASALGPHGMPHGQPVALPPDAAGSQRWLAFVGTPDVAVAAWRLTKRSDGAMWAEPTHRWPTAVRVAGAVVQDGVAYVMLETVAALDQPAGLRGVWTDGPAGRTPFDGSPLALADVRSVEDLAARVKARDAAGSAERNATALLGTLRAAALSPEALARTLASEGADVGVVWQSLFVQPAGHLDGQGAGPSSALDRALAIVRGAVETHACGIDACETWSDGGHAVVRFVVQGGRWVIRWVLEDAPVHSASQDSGRREVDGAPDGEATAGLLRARAATVSRVLGEAPLTAAGGTIGVGLTDLAPDAPAIALGEGAASRVFLMDDVTPRRAWTDTRWDVAFADVDGDGRTDVTLRLDGTSAGAPVSWTQVFLAPAPSVQATTLRPDLASSLATMDAADVHAAAHAAVSLPARGVAREDACRLLSAASTPGGFRKAASPDARVLLFDQPGMPTWLPKIVPSSKVGADDVRGLGAHCAELTCSALRPYCTWSGGSDSQHVWFSWRGADLAIAGAADYDGE